MTENRYIPLRDRGPEYRVGRCNNCRNRRVYVWHKDTGLRLDDVRCPVCDYTLDRTSREAHGYRMLSDEEIVAQREAAIKRTLERQAEIAGVAECWIQEIDLDPENEAHVYKCNLHADNYLRMAKEYDKTLKRLQDAEAAAAEAEAQEIAKVNPRHAIEGWAAGYQANGDLRNAAVMERALEIQKDWYARHEPDCHEGNIGANIAGGRA
jgi:hypothetical protein